MDKLLINGKIIDGTGSPWFRGWLALADGQIQKIGRDDPPTQTDAEVLDVNGAVICPGFIDTHSHSDLRLFTDPELSPKIRQGVTTEVLGQDGFSAAPMYRNEDIEQWKTHLSGLNGRIDQEWAWGSTVEYIDAIEEREISSNVATLVGHGTVRFNVLGMDDDDPTDEQLHQMADLVTEALSEGAIGFSTGLIYSPQAQASTKEVRLLASRLTPFGRPFVAHIRNESSEIWKALEEFIRIGETESIPIHLSHFKLAFPPQHRKAHRAIGILESARERQVDITADQYPYTAGSTTLTEVLPSWVHNGGPKATLGALQDTDDRNRIRQHIEHRSERWQDVIVTSVASTENKNLEGNTIKDIADERGVSPATAIMDLLIEEELEVSKVTHMLHEEDVREILAFPGCCIATDGLFGGKPHPRTFGTYPRVLGHYVRDESLLRLEEAIRMMTSLPARAMGFRRKGIIRSGMDADLAVFNPAAISSNATYEKPRQYPDGISHVFVNGEYVVQDGSITGKRPGEVIRGQSGANKRL